MKTLAYLFAAAAVICAPYVVLATILWQPHMAHWPWIARALYFVGLVAIIYGMSKTKITKQ